MISFHSWEKWAYLWFASALLWTGWKYEDCSRAGRQVSSSHYVLHHMQTLRFYELHAVVQCWRWNIVQYPLHDFSEEEIFKIYCRRLICIQLWGQLFSLLKNRFISMHHMRHSEWAVNPGDVVSPCHIWTALTRWWVSRGTIINSGFTGFTLLCNHAAILFERSVHLWCSCFEICSKKCSQHVNSLFKPCACTDSKSSLKCWVWILCNAHAGSTFWASPGYTIHICTCQDSWAEFIVLRPSLTDSDSRTGQKLCRSSSWCHCRVQFYSRSFNTSDKHFLARWRQRWQVIRET